MSTTQLTVALVVDVLFGIGAYMNGKTGIAIICGIAAILGVMMILLLKHIGD